MVQIVEGRAVSCVDTGGLDGAEDDLLVKELVDSMSSWRVPTKFSAAPT